MPMFILVILTFSKQAINESLDFATVHSLMKDMNLIDCCQAHLTVQYASNIEFICQKCHWCCDRQRATTESLLQNKPFVCSIGCPC